MRKSHLWLALAALVGALVIPSLATADEHAIDPSEYGHLSGSLAEMLANGSGAGGGSFQNQTCQTSGNPAANIDISCDDPVNPDNETPIVADPTNPDHLLAGSNDYFLTFKGGVIQERVPTGFFTSFDGGATWTDGQIPMGNGSSGGNGDPSPAFDRKFGTAHMAQLSAAFPLHAPFAGHI